MSISGVPSSEPWYSWRRLPDDSFLDKWVKPNQEARDRYLTFIETLANFDWRDNDVVITSFPKSGTHLLWYMTRLIVQKSPAPITDSMDQSHLGWDLYEPEKQNSLPRRVLNAHQLPSVLSPDTILKVFGTTWFQHVRAWDHFLKDHPQAPVLILYYEDVVSDPRTAIEKIASFLEIDLTEEMINDIAEETRFGKMKVTVPKRKDVFGPNGPPHSYRKGKVDDWKNWFTVAQRERFDRCVSEYLEGSTLALRYSSSSK